MDLNVKQILDRKGNDYYWVGPDASVFEALQKMAEKEIGALMVLENGKLIGMFSERDYARKLAFQGKTTKEEKVADFMSRTIHVISPDKTTLDCMEMMTKHKIRHLPVLDHNEIVGLISIGDVVNQIIQQQKATIKDLENYITGSGYGAESSE